MGKLQEIQDKFNLTKRYPDYFNKNVFRVALLLVVLLTAAVYISNDFKYKFIYVECQEESGCDNPFYVCQETGEINCINAYYIEPKDIEFFKEVGNIKRLENKQIVGYKPNFLALNYNTLSLFLFFGAFLINHLLYLRGKK